MHKRRLPHPSCKRIAAVVLPILCCIAGCRSRGSQAATSPSLRQVAPPARSGSMSPRVTAIREGSALLTWLEPTNDRLSTLRGSFCRDGTWSPPATIVAGQPISRHPSESPGVIALSETNLIAYWSTYISRSRLIAAFIGRLQSWQTVRGLARKIVTPRQRLWTIGMRHSSRSMVGIRRSKSVLH